jgi:hypothetical protein
VRKYQNDGERKSRNKDSPIVVVERNKQNKEKE